MVKLNLAKKLKHRKIISKLNKPTLKIQVSPMVEDTEPKRNIFFNSIRERNH